MCSVLHNYGNIQRMASPEHQQRTILASNHNVFVHILKMAPIVFDGPGSTWMLFNGRLGDINS